MSKTTAVFSASEEFNNPCPLCVLRAFFFLVCLAMRVCLTFALSIIMSREYYSRVLGCHVTEAVNKDIYVQLIARKSLGTSLYFGA